MENHQLNGINGRWKKHREKQNKRKASSKIAHAAKRIKTERRNGMFGF
jgi:hypothetical protein